MSGQVAFFPTNGRRPCILCDKWLGKGGGAPTWWIPEGYRLSIAKGAPPTLTLFHVGFT